MFSRLASRFVLNPSTNPVETIGSQHWIDFDGGRLEVWRKPFDDAPNGEGGVVVVKFLGAGGRAERATHHPAESLPFDVADVWAPNPPGYGSSSGKPCLSNIQPMAEAVIAAIRRDYPDSQLFICANSLGNLPALYVAANFGEQVAGLLLRNPPPLKQLIRARHPLWRTGGLSYFVARAVPQALCLLANAKRCHAPTLLVTSDSDRLVYPYLQNEVFSRLQGPKRQMMLGGADHPDPIPESQLDEYSENLGWLAKQVKHD